MIEQTHSQMVLDQILPGTSKVHWVPVKEFFSHDLLLGLSIKFLSK